jgi:hypothetical protein
MWAAVRPEGVRMMADKIEIPRIPRDPKPRRPSYDNVARNIEKWANSVGLQKPHGLDCDDLASPLPWSSSACGRGNE